uniref:NYN domain-containing protein n=1 Tax=Agromyces humi TaxID=1766800 RepID=UPI00135A9C0A
MPTSAEPRVALYFDFDNIVISRYDQVHGEGAYRKDTSRGRAASAGTQTAERLVTATVDIDAVLDFAATFGTIAIARAYADWSTPVNASYRGQLIDRAVDLVQLFPLSATKNGADIRLAVDAVEDMFRIDDLSHIVIVAGDSDYVALAQKAKRLGRYVVGIGVAGGTSRALTASCDEYADYDALLSTDAAVEEDEAVAVAAPGEGVVAAVADHDGVREVDALRLEAAERLAHDLAREQSSDARTLAHLRGRHGIHGLRLVGCGWRCPSALRRSYADDGTVSEDSTSVS